MEELDLKYLQYALAVVRYGSVTQAARALYLAQPNLSRAIGELEQSLGFPLFLRTRQGMSLTPQGERFLTEAETLLDRKHTLKTRWYGHLYTLLVVIFGFVLFRAESLPQALALLRAMLTGFAPVEGCRLALQNLLTAGTVFWCLAGAAACLPLWPLAKKRLAGSWWLSPALDVLTVLGLLLCLMQLASHSFQPFIYAGF